MKTSLFRGADKRTWLTKVHPPCLPRFYPDEHMTSPDQNRVGIGLMCLGILMFSLNDVMGKWLMATYTVGQVLALRSAAALLILLPFAFREGWGQIIFAQNPGLQMLRVAFATLEAACFYWSVAYLPLVSVMT